MRNKTMVCLLLVACIGMSMAIAVAQTAEDIDSLKALAYGKTNVQGINVRKKPSEKADVVVKLPITGTAVVIVEHIDEDASIAWYAVEVGEDHGYIRADLLQEITKEEYDLNMQSTAKPAKKATSKPASSKIQALNASASGSDHSGYAGSTAVYTSGGIYHSDRACPKTPEGASQSTLTAAQSAGMSPCSMCWCYECLFVE